MSSCSEISRISVIEMQKPVTTPTTLSTVKYQELQWNKVHQKNAGTDDFNIFANYLW